jgi:hypothetical protein
VPRTPRRNDPLMLMTNVPKGNRVSKRAPAERRLRLATLGGGERRHRLRQETAADT